MFVDYYAVLDISVDATNEEIKKAYREQSKKWHPDKNKGIDTKEQMQLINEANLILKDAEARSKYDIEYNFFKKSSNSFEEIIEDEDKGAEFKEAYSSFTKSTKYEYKDYEVRDPELSKWMKNAKNQSIQIVEQFFSELGTLTQVGVKAVLKEMWEKFLIFLVLGIIGSIIYMIAK